MKINEIVTEDLSRRGFLKGLGAAATVGAGAGITKDANAQSINLIQKQYDWQFSDTKGNDRVVNIVNRDAGGRVAVTARNQYFLIYNWDDVKSKLPKGFDPGPYGIVLLAVPKDILSGNSTTTSTPSKKEKSHQASSDKQSEKNDTAKLKQDKEDYQKQDYEKNWNTNDASDSYKARIIAVIRPAISVSNSDLSSYANPVDMEIYLSPNGTITGRKLLKSSGSPIFDIAVMNAFDKTGRLPRDETGQVPSKIRIQIDNTEKQIEEDSFDETLSDIKRLSGK